MHAEKCCTPRSVARFSFGDMALRAVTRYFTKYDCSSADINPIGAISKNDLKNFLLWGAEQCVVGMFTDGWLCLWSLWLLVIVASAAGA